MAPAASTHCDDAGQTSFDWFGVGPAAKVCCHCLPPHRLSAPLPRTSTKLEATTLKGQVQTCGCDLFSVMQDDPAEQSHLCRFPFMQNINLNRLSVEFGTQLLCKHLHHRHRLASRHAGLDSWIVEHAQQQFIMVGQIGIFLIVIEY